MADEGDGRCMEANSEEMPSAAAEGAKDCGLERLRSLVRCYADRHELDSALFWADKVVSLSGGEPRDVYWHANALYLTGQYLRASHLLQSHKLDKRFLIGRHLRAQCLFSGKEYQEALNILDQVDSEMALPGKDSSKIPLEKPHPDMPSENVESAISLLRGKIYEALDNRALAMNCFKEALQKDVYCYEAFECLVQHQMMTAEEEKQLLKSLPFVKQCSAEELSMVKFLYESMLKKYDRPPDMDPPAKFVQLADNYDVVVAVAERLYYNCNFQEAYRMTSEILKLDPYNHRCLPLHITILVELKKLNELFYLAHKLVDLYPGNAVAWFAVGCYYYLCNKHEPARRYLSKSTMLHRVFGPAWLVYGHSFAAENEHDQAMAAYLTASQLMKGCHLPLLYIGLEYGLTNNSKLADRFFCQALQIAPNDPFVLHEIGVVAFQNREYEDAERNFLHALKQIESSNHDVISEKWEPLLNNLGHVCRKLKKYNESLDYHRQSLVLCPHNPATYSAMGFSYALQGNFLEAVDCFHKALGLRKDDSFSTTMLQNTIEQLVSESKACEDLPDPLPPYTYQGQLTSAKVSSESFSESQSEFESSRIFNISPVIIPAEIQDVEMEDA